MIEKETESEWKSDTKSLLKRQKMIEKGTENNLKKRQKMIDKETVNEW